MFGDHKGHDVASLEEGYKHLQEQIGLAFNHGHLKVANHNTKLIQVKHTILLCDEIEDKLSTEIKESFKEIRKLLDLREKKVLNEVKSVFNTERGKLEEAQQVWENRIDVVNEVLGKLSAYTNKEIELIELMRDAKTITSQLNGLKQNIIYKDISVPNEVVNSMVIKRDEKDIVISFNELKDIIADYVSIANIQKYEYSY